MEMDEGSGGAAVEGQFDWRVAPGGTRAIGLADGPRQALIDDHRASAGRRRGEGDERTDCLLATLGHEVRTPLTVIIGNARLLRSRALVLDAARDLLDDIEVEAERLSAIVDDLHVMSLASRGDGDFSVATEPVLLQRLLPAIMERAGRQFPAARIELVIPPDLPVVEADPMFVRQIVTNLLSNAAKYAGNAPNIQVVAEAHRDSVTITCRDDGPGFPPEALGRAFEAFYRAPGAAGRAAGTGLGLYVVRRLAEAMGGVASCANVPKSGAMISVGLLRADERAGLQLVSGEAAAPAV